MTRSLAAYLVVGYIGFSHSFYSIRVPAMGKLPAVIWKNKAAMKVLYAWCSWLLCALQCCVNAVTTFNKSMMMTIMMIGDLQRSNANEFYGLTTS